jgi:hypothetical protein
MPEDQKPSLHIYLSGKQSRLEVVHALSLKSCLFLAMEPVGLKYHIELRMSLEGDITKYIPHEAFLYPKKLPYAVVKHVCNSF